MRLLRLSFLIALPLACTSHLNSQSMPAYPPTLWAPCEAFHSPNRTIEGPTLVAKASGYTAKVKVESKLDDSPSPCSNTTTLIVDAAGARKTIHIVPEVKDQLDGNGMNLVDWSPDGKLLVAEVWRWTQAGNNAGIDNRVFVYTAHPWSSREIKWDLFLADQPGRSCNLQFDLLGFTPEGRVAMKVDITQWYDPTEELSDIPLSRRCIEKHQAWAVDPVTMRRSPLAKDFQPRRYSETSAATPQAR